MRLRAIAVCAALLGLLTQLPHQLTESSAEAGWKQRRSKAKRKAKTKRKICRRRRCRKKKNDKPQTETRQVQLTLVGTDMGFAFINGENVPTFVDADIFNGDGTLVGTYAEIFEPIWDENNNFVGLMGVATWNFNGLDASLSGTLMTDNVSLFTGSEFREPFEFISVETAGTITDSTGDLAGSTGSAAMNTTAIFDGFFFLFDASVTLTLESAGGGDGGVDRERRRCRQRVRRRR